MTRPYFFSVKHLLVAMALVLGGTMPAEAATAYAPFGQISKQPWQAKCLFQRNNWNDPEGWASTGFDDSSWATTNCPVSTANGLSYQASTWSYRDYIDDTEIFIRRHFTVDRIDQDYYVLYVTHDDDCQVYLNGVEVYRNGNYLVNPDYHTVYLPKELLRVGDNLLAARVGNSSGEAFADFGLYGADAVSWTSVELATPGSLGQEVLYKVDMLSDVEYLKVKGTMNDDDWTTIKNMANLKGVDLSGAKATRVPDEQFRDRGMLHLAKLPAGLTAIGRYAFSHTSLTDIVVPATVMTIGEYAFEHCNLLGSVTFENGSRLATLGHHAFYYCNKLHAVALPSSLTTLQSNVFQECYSLSSVVLPAALSSIGEDCFYQTPSLHAVDFPASLERIERGAFYQSGLERVALPHNLGYLGADAFCIIPNLKHVELPVTTVLQSDWNSWGYYSTFSNCPAIEEVVCLSATPPAIGYDPFSGLDRSKVTLTVPAFAVVDYKLDTYWHEFGTIREGAEPTVLNLAGGLSLTNDRRPANKVDVTLGEGARLTVGGNAPFEVGTLTFTVNMPNNSFGQLQNTTTAMSADRVQSSCFVYANRWYFITTLHDVSVADVTHSNAEASFIFRRYNAQNRAVNGPQGSWQDLTDNTLRAGQGYILQTNRDGWLTLPATATGKQAALVSSDATTPLVTNNAPNSADAHWNYIGNPYACYYDIYYMDLAAPITVWDYDAWTYRAYSPVDDNYVLRPTEAFFVQKPDGLSQVLFRSEGRQFNAEVQRVAEARRNGDDGRHLFDLCLSDGQRSDVTRVVFNADASATYEPARDAAKFLSSEGGVPQLYTIDDAGNRLAINERPAGTVRLGLSTVTTATFTISRTRGEGSLLLTDSKTGLTTDLSRESYTFIVAGGASTDNRFTLTPGSDATTISEIANGKSLNGKWYDMQGRRLEGQPSRGLYIKDGQKVVVR